MIVKKITSKEPKHRGISLTNDDLSVGLLDFPGFVQVDAIYALEKTIIRDIIGMAGPEKMKEIKTQIVELFAIIPNKPGKKHVFLSNRNCGYVISLPFLKSPATKSLFSRYISEKKWGRGKTTLTFAFRQPFRVRMGQTKWRKKS